MKIFRKLSALVMVLALVLSMSLSALAVNYDAASTEDLWTAFGDTSGEDVYINLTDNVDAGYASMQGQEGVSYSIGTENGSTLSNVGFVGSTTVEVDTNVGGYLYADDEAQVTVNGDVNGMVNAYSDSTVTVEGNVAEGVYASENAEVSVGGDVEGWVDAYGDSTVTVDGKVDESVFAGEGAEVAIGGDVNGSIYADGNSTVTAEGKVAEDVYAGETAEVAVGGNVTGWVDAYGDSTITVEGSVSEGVYTDGTAEVTVGGDVNGGINAYGDSTVTVTGDANGADGNPNAVDYSDPESYSDGSSGVWAFENATVIVGGDVTGGDSYGNFGYGGSAVNAFGEATVIVKGNVTGGSVTADPATESEYIFSVGGTGINAEATATVTVGGDVTGGSTNGANGIGGCGAVVYYGYEGEAGSVNVGGNVKAGTGTNEISDLVVVKFEETQTVAPIIRIGYCESIEGYGLTEEELEAVKSEVKASFIQKSIVDMFWVNVLRDIRNAEPGDKITVDAGNRISVPAEVLQTVVKCEVELTIRWNGGEDLVIDKEFSEELTGDVLLKDLAEMLQK